MKTKAKKNTETHFRFNVRLASALGNSREFTEEDADPNAALARLAKGLANSGLSSPTVHEAKVTIHASRRFISTFKPFPGE